MVDEDEIHFEAPPPLAVARRALILSGVVCRAFLENAVDERYKRETAAAIHDWFQELGLWSSVEPDEMAILNCEFGKMPERLRIRGTWFVEGLSVLAWAMGRSDFPPNSDVVDPFDVTDSLCFLDESAKELLGSPYMRGSAELKAAREWFYDLHCTLRGFLHYRGKGRLAPWIGHYLEVIGLPAENIMRDGGLLFDGKPLVDSERGHAERWETIVCERHRATIWLAGEQPVYTELTVDT